MRDFDYRLPPTLNGDQERAAEGILALFREDRPVALLAGAAGTGKTFTLAVLIAVWREAGIQVHPTATTNKAASVVAQMLGEGGNAASTVHRWRSITSPAIPTLRRAAMSSPVIAPDTAMM